MKKTIIKWLCIAAIILGGIAVVSDAVELIVGFGQYAFNFAYFLVCPFLIYGTGVTDFVESAK